MHVLFCSKVTKREVLENDGLLSAFTMFVRCHQTSTVDEDGFCSKIITRVVNTMSNSFFQCMDMMDRVATNKGVDAHMSLRDKLEAYALEFK